MLPLPCSRLPADNLELKEENVNDDAAAAAAAAADDDDDDDDGAHARAVVRREYALSAR